MPRRLARRPPPSVFVLAAALLFAGATDGQGPPQVVDCQGVIPNGWRVRCEVNEVDKQWMDDFRAGVALMKSRPATAKNSWIYQANMHGVPTAGHNCAPETTPMQTAWATCQHGSFFFLAWHRMYLYYFERFLLEAIREATRKATEGESQEEIDKAMARVSVWTLPYWDYEKNSTLPEAFRLPAADTNPLWVKERSADCNAGKECIPASVASATKALEKVASCSCPKGQASCDGCQPKLHDDTFMGGLVPGATHFADATGALEQQPHNVVHNTIGAGTGWMSDPACAARDPIFWLHHANIDRLWQVWRNQKGGRLAPLTSNTWRDEKFTFFRTDNQGQVVEVQMTGCDILHTIWQLEYAYTGTPAWWDGLPEQGVWYPPCMRVKPPTTTPRAVIAAPRILAIRQPEQPLSLGADRATMAVEVERAAIASLGGSGEIRVVVGDLELVNPGAVYEVYLNLPADVEPDWEGPYFLGNVSVFGHASGRGHVPVLHSQSFDVSDQVHALSSREEWTGALVLTFVRANPSPAGTAAPATHIRVGNLSVEHRG